MPDCEWIEPWPQCLGGGRKRWRCDHGWKETAAAAVVTQTVPLPIRIIVGAAPGCQGLCAASIARQMSMSGARHL
jgi:hypothetical protein